MNDIIPPKNRKRGLLPVEQRPSTPVGPRVGYDTLYMRRTVVTEEPSVVDEQPVITEQTTIVETPISVRMAVLLEEALEEQKTEQVPIPEVVVSEEAPIETIVVQEVADVEPVTPEEIVEAAIEVQPQTSPVVTEEVEVVLKHGVPELSVDRKVAAMTRALEQARKDLDKEHRKRFALKRITLGLVGLVLLLATGYVGIDTLMTNGKVKADTGTGNMYDSPNVVHDQSQEGKDTSALPVNALANYQVAPDLPRAIYIEKLGIAARTLHMGVNPDGTVQAPINVFDAGWYTGSVKPDQNGAVFVDAHSSGSSQQGLFGKLDKLEVGDIVQIETGDSSRILYKVAHKETVKLENVDMRKALKPYGDAKKGLNLMTCAGQWTSDNSTLDERTIIYTQQI